MCKWATGVGTACGFPTPSKSAVLYRHQPTGCPAIQLISDTTYLELVQTPQVKSSVLQDCPHFRCQSKLLGPQGIDSSVQSDTNWGSHNSFLGFNNYHSGSENSRKHFIYCPCVIRDITKSTNEMSYEKVDRMRLGVWGTPLFQHLDVFTIPEARRTSSFEV